MTKKIILRVVESAIACWFVLLFIALLGVVGGIEMETITVKAGILAECGIVAVGILSYWVLV